MMDSIKTEQVHRIEDLIRLCDLGKAYSSPVLYRGQKCDLPLVPKILRPWDKKKREISEVLQQEKWLLDEFARQAASMIPVPSEPCDSLSIAQHHGLPTRLLDWTQNPIAALWFAIEGRETKDQPVVWRLETNIKDFDDGHRFMNPPQTVVYRPKHVTDRIRVQSGWFTVHQIKKDKTYPFENLVHYKNRLTKFIITGSANMLQWRLNDMGVNRASLFPDLGNLCEHLGWESRWLKRSKNAALASGFVAQPKT